MNDPATTPMLTADLLEGLLDSLTRAGFPTRERLYPGLTDEQMDEITAPLGLTLPTEARVWWSRHNGGAEALIGSDRAAARLQDMVAQAEQARVVQRMYEDDGVYSWEDRLLPLVQSSGEIFACDCSVPDGAPSPIWLYIPKQCETLKKRSCPRSVPSLRSGSPRSTKASTSSYPTRATRSCTTSA